MRQELSLTADSAVLWSLPLSLGPGQQAGDRMWWHQGCGLPFTRSWRVGSG